MRALYLTATRVQIQEAWLGVLPDGGQDELQALQTHVGGLIAPVYLDGATMYTAEEQTATTMPVNDVATEIAVRDGAIPTDAQIRGNVVIVGPLDIYGRDTDLTEAVKDRVYTALGVGEPSPVGFLAGDIARYLQRVRA